MVRMRIVTIKMPQELVEELDKIAWELGMCRSELYRMVLAQFTRSYNSRKKQVPRIRVLG